MVILELWTLESTSSGNQSPLKENVLTTSQEEACTSSIVQSVTPSISSSEEALSAASIAAGGTHLHHYCIVRKDLPLGDRFAQLIHAAGESSPGNLPHDTHAVALEAADEADLLDLERKLLDHSIGFCSIREPDAPYFNQLMAIGIHPQVRSKSLRKIMSRFALVK